MQRRRSLVVLAGLAGLHTPPAGAQAPAVVRVPVSPSGYLVEVVDGLYLSTRLQPPDTGRRLRAALGAERGAGRVDALLRRWAES